jgi:hypothetical protein
MLETLMLPNTENEMNGDFPKTEMLPNNENEAEGDYLKTVMRETPVFQNEEDDYSRSYQAGAEHSFNYNAY